MNILDILKTSSLRGMVSDMEIAELAEEISTEIEEIIEAEVEKTKDDFEDEKEDYSKEADDLRKEISALKKMIPGDSTLEDSMAMEWVSDNWEEVKSLYRRNLDFKEINRSVEAAIYGIDAVATLTKILNQEIVNATSKNHKRIVLVGRAASGKDHMRKMLEEKGFKYAVSYTTRPPRTGEVNGKDYFFLSVEEFERMIQNDEFYEYVSFNNWYYGTTKEQFYNDDVFIMTPHGISHVKPQDRKDTFIMFLDMKLGVRQRRLLQRSDADSVERRLAADDKDFTDFKNYDIRITNHDF
jgi:guanylate kinase